MSRRSAADVGRRDEPRWYQTTIREMLLLTVLVALVLSLLNTFGIRKIWVTASATAFFAWPFFEAFFLFRRLCRKHGIWDSEDWSMPSADAESACQDERSEVPVHGESLGSATSGPVSHRCKGG